MRGRWAAARAFLRRTLAGPAGADPADLTFAYSRSGKPSLASGPEFSLAHSGDLALLAWCSDTPVGADLELVRPGLAGRPSAERFFTESERAELDALAEPKRVARFFELWTLKEAYLKATGEGVSGRSLGALPDAGWLAERPPLPAGYAGAVAVLADRAVFDFA